MPDYESSMREVVVATRNLLEAERTTSGLLKSVRQVKRGVLPVRPNYPCVTVVPNSEQVIQYRSGRRAVVQRDVTVHVLTMDLRGRAGFDIAKDIADTSLNILRSDVYLTESGGHLNSKFAEFGKMEYNGGQPISSAGLYNVNFPVTYFSNESLPARVVYTGSQVDNPTSRQIGEAIRTKLWSKKATTLSKFQSMVLEEWEPGTKFPRLQIQVVGEEQSPKPQGVDTIYGEYEIQIETLVGSARDTSMDFHLDQLEPVKDALQEEDHWDGKTLSSEIGSIQFNTSKVGDRPIYTTTMTYRTKSKQNVH
jgi:hypothetical protein